MINYVLIFIQYFLIHYGSFWNLRFLRYISGEDSDSDGKGWFFFEYVIGAVV